MDSDSGDGVASGTGTRTGARTGADTGTRTGERTGERAGAGAEKTNDISASGEDMYASMECSSRLGMASIAVGSSGDIAGGMTDRMSGVDLSP